MSEQNHTPEPLCPATLPFAIMDQEMEDLMRFHECATDGEGYDVPKDRMKRLAEIGLLRRVTANFYEHTIFGLSIINGDFQQKSEVEKQRDELLTICRNVVERGIGASDVKAMKAAIASAKDQLPDATKMIGAPATANYPHGSLGEAVESEGGES